MAGGLTLIGGALTIASAGAALPILLAGTGLGLASGVGGGAAAVTEKVIKSQQMKAAKSAIEEDALATTHLENKARYLHAQTLQHSGTLFLEITVGNCTIPG